MKALASFIVKFRYWISGVIMLLMVLSLFWMGNVSINYNISDYLDGTTGTKQALTIMTDEFGLTGNVQVLLKGISKEDAKEVKDQLSNIDGVLTVSFDTEDKNYYRDENALFVVLTEGDDYSDEGTRIVHEIKDLFGDTAYYGGSTVEKNETREALTFQIPIILALCILIAYVILIFTTGSWLEPILFLLTAGVAVLINRGTNVMFGSISYITNSIAAILQLALALDYSVMLLHAFHKYRKSLPEREAMVEALSESIRPVSTSALTTMAGLLALLFMSFTIGFDIGMVLMKGIVVSAIVAFTLFPCVILLFSKVLDKAKITLKKGKKSPDFTAKLSGFSIKFRVLMSIVSAVLIVVGLIIQSFSVYTFSDESASSNEIGNVFGDNSALVLVYENGEDTSEKQEEFVKRISAYRANGLPVLKSYTAYTNTVLEGYNEVKMVSKLDLSEDNAKNLFVLYHLYDVPESVMMKPAEFLTFTDYLIREDNDAKETASEDMILTIQRIGQIRDILSSYQSVDTLIEKLSTKELSDFVSVDEFYIRQAYAMYRYPKLKEKGVTFSKMLDYLVEKSDSDLLEGLLNEDTKADLIKLQEGIETFLNEAGKELSQEEFQKKMRDDYDVSISSSQISLLYRLYGGLTAPEKVPFISMLSFMNGRGLIEGELSEEIDRLNGVYETILGSSRYDTFFDDLRRIVDGLTGETVEMDFSEDGVFQLFLMYFVEQGKVPNITIQGESLIEFILSEVEKSEFLQERLEEKTLSSLRDALVIRDFLAGKEKVDFHAMASQINEMIGRVSSVTYDSVSEAIVSGVYLKRAILSGNYDKTPIIAKDLLAFIQREKKTNELLTDRIDEEMSKQIDDAQKQIEKAEDLFLGEHYTRVIFNVALPTESEESYAFAEFVNTLTNQIFEGKAFMAGEIMSTYDLRDSFAYDRILISVFTLVSIFVIILVMFRSLLIPVLLVAVIQGSIWLCLSSFVVSMNPVFFMSYIVASCILMGATIDYGILMSSTYVNMRKECEREEALAVAVKTALPTILSSGLVLMCCGFFINFIIAQVSIATVGLFIGIGTLLSMLMIVFLLPSLLALFDRGILATTLGARQKKTKKEA